MVKTLIFISDLIISEQQAAIKHKSAITNLTCFNTELAFSQVLLFFIGL